MVCVNISSVCAVYHIYTNQITNTPKQETLHIHIYIYNYPYPTNTHTHIYIFQASDLGLVKDTPVWPSPISSCVGPPLDKSQLIRCPYEIRNYV